MKSVGTLNLKMINVCDAIFIFRPSSHSNVVFVIVLGVATSLVALCWNQGETG